MANILILGGGFGGLIKRNKTISSFSPINRSRAIRRSWLGKRNGIEFAHITSGKSVVSE